MRESVGTTTIFQYVLLFTFLFSAFLALAITYNRVFKLKNESISIIEKYEGIRQNGQTLELINNYLINSGYKTKGNCESDEYGVSDLNNPTYELSKEGTKYYYCLKDRVEKGNNSSKIYYDLKLFYKFNLPFIGELFTFNINGETKGINYYDTNQGLKE